MEVAAGVTGRVEDRIGTDALERQLCLVDNGACRVLDHADTASNGRCHCMLGEHEQGKEEEARQQSGKGVFDADGHTVLLGKTCNWTSWTVHPTLTCRLLSLMQVYVAAPDHVNDRFRLWLFGAARVDHAKLNVYSAVRLLSP